MRNLRFRSWVNDHWTDWLPTIKTLGLYNEVLIDEDDYSTDSKCYIEQYTGVRDKNGKEIFEGDVVSEHNGDIKGKVVQSVTGEWQIAWIGIFGGYSCLYEHTSLCEVIGNIHENEELLKGK